MKKHIIIALAAAVALAACTKVSVDEQLEKISFQVASYMVQTKATGTSLLNEGCNSFYTNAWYTPGTGSVQYFMQNVEILPDANSNPTTWAPADAYYWPKSGTLNFFSYASKNALAASELDFGESADPKGTVFTITGHNVAADDNIMIADAVYNAGIGNKEQNDITDSDNSNDPQGVPTLMRHLLSQISFTIGLATPSAASGTTNFEATITSATLKNVVNKGSLALTANASDATGLNTKTWSPASDGTAVGWTAATSTEDITLTAPAHTLTLAESATSGNVEDMLVNRTVLPQAISSNDDIEIEIVYNLDTKHGTTVYTHQEGLTVTGKLKNVTAVPSWNMNQRITYNVTINPITDLITFDPAVVAWTTTSGTLAL